jgi:hypothetical protein
VAQEEVASLLLATGGAFQLLPPPLPPPAAPLQISTESDALYKHRAEDEHIGSCSVMGARPMGEAVHLVEEMVFAPQRCRGEGLSPVGARYRHHESHDWL